MNLLVGRGVSVLGELWTKLAAKDFGLAPVESLGRQLGTCRKICGSGDSQ